jgi:hypothetical protein
MANVVKDALTGAGHPPKDLLDVYDFMLVTLRPAATKILADVRRSIDLNEDAPPAVAAEAAPEEEAEAADDEVDEDVYADDLEDAEAV